VQSDREPPVSVRPFKPDQQSCGPISSPDFYQHPLNGMPSPMDECDNRMNIDTTSPSNELKRKLDGSIEELSFPCKKAGVSPITITKVNGVIGEELMTPTKNGTSLTQVKLSKAEKEALKLEKAREREAERLRREQEKLKREEEKQKREEERQKKQAERDELKKKRDSEKEEARKEREIKEREKEEQRRKKEEEQEKKQRVSLRETLRSNN